MRLFGGGRGPGSIVCTPEKGGDADGRYWTEGLYSYSTHGIAAGAPVGVKREIDEGVVSLSIR